MYYAEVCLAVKTVVFGKLALEYASDHGEDCVYYSGIHVSFHVGLLW